MKESKDVERLYQNYIRYQSGDKTALDEVFIEVGKKVGETKRIVELEEEYKLSHTENVLDVELVENEIEYRRKNRKLKVVFSFLCLNNMVRKAKYEYSKNGIFTGYENGKKMNFHGYKKFHSGKYDTFELEEEMQEIVIKLFQGKLSGSNTDIVDGRTLLENIKYYLTIQIGKYNELLCKNVSETYVDAETGEELSRFDRYSETCWLQSKGRVSRLLLYADALKWLRKNNIHNLFNTTSFDIHAIIDATLKNEHVFEQGKNGGLRLQKQKELRNIIHRTECRDIEEKNISSDLKLVEQRFIDHLLYSLDYYIGKAPENNGSYERESNRYLYKYETEAYSKIFSRERMTLYEICHAYIDNFIGVNECLVMLQKYEDIMFPILMGERGIKKYDMINLLTMNDDVVSEDFNIVLQNIVNTIMNKFDREEAEKIDCYFKQYEVERKEFPKGYKYWEAELLKNEMKIKMWSGEDIKNPIRYKISRDCLLVFEGYQNYYFFDCGNKKCYTLIKDKRIISKSDEKHKIIFHKIA